MNLGKHMDSRPLTTSNLQALLNLLARLHAELVGDWKTRDAISRVRNRIHEMVEADRKAVEDEGSGTMGRGRV